MSTPLNAQQIFSGMRTILDQDPPNMTMDKPLVINVAPTGSFVTRDQNPHIPYTPSETAEQVIASYEAGARVWHIHCRDENGIPSKDPAVILKTQEMVRKYCPDIIMSVNVIADYSKVGAGLIKPIVDGLTEAGPEYMHTAVITPYTTSPSDKWVYLNTEKTIREKIDYIQARGVKPEFQNHNYQCMSNVQNWLINPGLLTSKPYIMNLILGFHADHYSGPSHPDPWGWLYLISMMNLLPQDSVRGLTIGGRNWLPLTTVGVMLGFDMVRVGMEDTIFMYPHKTDYIKHSAETVTKVVNIATELGRKIATPEETRAILGIAPRAASV